MITEAQLNKLAYNDLMIKNMLSSEQKKAIEYKRSQRIKNNRIRAV
jgi:hypothetical protein